MIFPSMQPEIRLLTAQDRERRALRRINLAPDVQLMLQMESVPTDLGRPLIRQTISTGGSDELEIYPAPDTALTVYHPRRRGPFYRRFTGCGKSNGCRNFRLAQG